MGFDVAIGSAETKVREKALRRETACTVGAPSSAFLVIAPVSPPRLWRWIADEVTAAFERAVENQPPTGATVGRGADAAAHAIARVRTQLIETELTIDAQVGIVLTAPDALHVALSAGVRLYRARNGVPERLLGNQPRPDGVACGTLHVASERAQPGDLFVLGTRESFTVRSIGGLAGALARNARPPVSELVDAVITPCRDAGVGAAAVVMRVT